MFCEQRRKDETTLINVNEISEVYDWSGTDHAKISIFVLASLSGSVLEKMHIKAIDREIRLAKVTIYSSSDICNYAWSSRLWYLFEYIPFARSA